MSSWSMSDGTTLTQNITTNGTTALTAAGALFTTAGNSREIDIGDVVVTNGGESVRVLRITNSTTAVLTVAAAGSESGVAGTVRKPPTNGMVDLPDSEVYGIAVGEAKAGVDNITSIAVNFAGSGYKGSAPAVTVPVPTVHTIAMADVTHASDSITITNHKMRTGTELKYQDGGGAVITNLVDNTSYFVIRIDEDTIKLAANLAHANAGTVKAIAGTGNNAQTLEGIQGVAAATISGGIITAVTVSNVGSDYQTVPAITIAAPAEQTFNAASAVTGAAIAITAHPYLTGDKVTYSDKGGTKIAELTDGGTYYTVKVDANTVNLATTEANAVAGTVLTLTDGPSENHSLTGETATAVANLGLGDSGNVTSSEIAHVGWVKRTVGTGGRAGRVHYETLVAASSISGDHEDIATPEDA